TSRAATSVRGLKDFFRISENSSSSWSAPLPPTSVLSCVDIASLPRQTTDISVHSSLKLALSTDGALRAPLIQRRHQRRIRKQLAQLFLGRRLSVHIALQIGQLLTCLEQGAKRWHLTGDLSGREILHLGEIQGHAE